MLEQTALRARRRIALEKVLDTVLNVFKDEYSDLVTVTDMPNDDVEKKIVGINYAIFEYDKNLLNKTIEPIEALDMLEIIVKTALGSDGYLIEAKKAIMLNLLLGRILNLYHILTMKDIEEIDKRTVDMDLLDSVLSLDTSLENNVYVMNDITKTVLEKTLKDLEWNLMLVEIEEKESTNITGGINRLFCPKSKNIDKGKRYKFVRKT